MSTTTIHLFHGHEKPRRRISRTLRLITMVPLPMDLADTRASITSILRSRKIQRMKDTIGR